MIICLVCGSENQPNQKNCAKCHAVIPKMDYSTSTSAITGGRVTGRFELFQDAVRKLKMAEWTPDEFGHLVENMQNLLGNLASSYVMFVEESGHADNSIDEVEMCFSGIEDYEAGMATLISYLDTGDMSLLDTGLQLIWDGNEKINEGQRLNLEFQRTLEEEWGYMQ